MSSLPIDPTPKAGVPSYKRRTLGFAAARELAKANVAVVASGDEKHWRKLANELLLYAAGIREQLERAPRVTALGTNRRQVVISLQDAERIINGLDSLIKAGGR